jgi:hypothetical protein
MDFCFDSCRQQGTSTSIDFVASGLKLAAAAMTMELSTFE